MLTANVHPRSERVSKILSDNILKQSSERPYCDELYFFLSSAKVFSIFVLRIYQLARYKDDIPDFLFQTCMPKIRNAVLVYRHV